MSGGVAVVETLPEEAHSPIVYPAVVLGRSDKREQAAAFIEFLASEEASRVFRETGFGPDRALERGKAETGPLMAAPLPQKL